jgi:kinetochore protein NNF1
MHAHLDGVRASQQSQLNAKLQTIQSQNAILGKKMLEQRREIAELMQGLERVVGDLEGAGATFAEQGTSLADGAREAEVVMADL